MTVAPGGALVVAPDAAHPTDTAWKAIVTAEEECAALWRSCGLRAFALRDPLLRTEIQPGEPLLLIDKAARAVADLRQMGAGELWQASTPAPYRWPSEFLRDRAAVAGCDLSAMQMLELSSLIFDSAQLVRNETGDTFNDLAKPRRRARRLDIRALIAQGAQPMLLHGLLPQVGVGFLVGASNTGKSTLAVDIAAHVASGMAWNGRETQRGFVTYLAAEDPDGIAARIHAWEQHHNAAEIAERIDLWTDAPPIDTAAGAREMADIISDQKARGRPPSLYVIDTLATSLAGPEDKTEIAAPTMAMLGAAARRAQCCVVIVHHPKKPQVGAPGGVGDALRGSSAWVGAADFVLQVQETFGGIDLLTLKERNGRREDPIPLALQTVNLHAGGTGIVTVARTSDGPLDGLHTTLEAHDRKQLAPARRKLARKTP